MNSYRLVYEASLFDAGLWAFMGAGVVFITIGLGLVRVRGPSRKTWVSNWPPSPIFAWFFFLFSVFWTLLAASSLIPGMLAVHQAVANKSYRTIAGPVQDFHPMPVEGHANETFTVQGVQFSYSDYEMRAGYRQSESHGGFVHKTSDLRIGYVCQPDDRNCSDPVIVRLEVAVVAAAPGRDRH